jgi:acyl-CoA reductase-like NAD-dependent aldehyde dehydrogenase
MNEDGCMSLEAIRPATCEVIATYEETPASQLPGIVDRAHKAFLSWAAYGLRAARNGDASSRRVAAR